MSTKIAHVNEQENLGEPYAWCRASHEDQTPKICGPLVAQCPSGIDKSTDPVRLDSAPDEGRAPGSGGAGCFLGLQEFLFGVGGFGALVGVTKDWRENCEGGAVVEERTQGNGRGLDGWEVCERALAKTSSDSFIVETGETVREQQNRDATAQSFV